MRLSSKAPPQRWYLGRGLTKAWGWAMCKHVEIMLPGEGTTIYWELLRSRSYARHWKYMSEPGFYIIVNKWTKP